MPDLLVKLYDLPETIESLETLKEQGISIKRVLSPDKGKVLDFIRTHFNENWVNEADCAFGNNPITCFIAVKEKKIIGFACYDATAKNYFGPTGVEEQYRGLGIGKVLLLKCLFSMRENGYGYAIIGWANKAKDFYFKTVNAIEIEGSTPGIYKRMVDID